MLAWNTTSPEECGNSAIAPTPSHVTLLPQLAVKVPARCSSEFLPFNHLQDMELNVIDQAAIEEQQAIEQEIEAEVSARADARSNTPSWWRISEGDTNYTLNLIEELNVLARAPLAVWEQSWQGNQYDIQQLIFNLSVVAHGKSIVIS